MSEALQLAVVWWWRWLPPLALQSAVLLAVVWILDRLLPERTWGEVRTALWLLPVARLVLPPALASPVALARWVPPTLAQWGPALDPVTWQEPAARTAAWWVAGLWGVGLLVLLLRDVVRARAIRRWWHCAAEPTAELQAQVDRAAARLGLTRAPAVRVAAGLEIPFVTGLLRPRVLLPTGLSAEAADHVLLHELAHVRRWDLWATAGLAVVGRLYWFHPGLSIAARRLEELREEACDRTVARALGGEVGPYRRTLLGFAARATARPDARPVSQAALALLRPRAAILRRLAALERPPGPRWPRRLAAAMVAGLLVACVLPTAQRAENAALAVAELVERPPGCLPLRYLVLSRLAAEAQKTAPTPPPSEETP